MITQGERGYWKEFLRLAIINFTERELDTKTKGRNINWDSTYMTDLIWEQYKPERKII